MKLTSSDKNLSDDDLHNAPSTSSDWSAPLKLLHDLHNDLIFHTSHPHFLIFCQNDWQRLLWKKQKKTEEEKVDLVKWPVKVNPALMAGEVFLLMAVTTVLNKTTWPQGCWNKFRRLRVIQIYIYIHICIKTCWSYYSNVGGFIFINVFSTMTNLTFLVLICNLIAWGNKMVSPLLMLFNNQAFCNTKSEYDNSDGQYMPTHWDHSFWQLKKQCVDVWSFWIVDYEMKN